MASRTGATKISRPDTTADPGKLEARITKVEHVASYSWLDKAKPTISVPGFPPRWAPLSGPQRLPPDAGIMYIDRNADLNPSSPMEPLFRAVAAEKPGFALRSVDVVTDRNNLRKLLRFVRASSEKSFRIRVEMVGERSVLLSRVEPETTETVVCFRGFGHAFASAYTRNEGSNLAYYRIVSYDFAGLRCLVRHSTDGYVADKKGKPTRLVRGPEESVDDELANAMKGLSMPKSEESKVTNPNPTDKTGSFAVETGGRVVDISSTLEIKTRAMIHGQLDLAETLPQLWFAQTPNLVAAFHHRGAFVDVELRDATDEMRQWEAANKRSLYGLSLLLREIIRLVKLCPGRKAVVGYDGGDHLRLVPDKGGSVLPGDLYALWGEEKAQEGKSEDGEEKKKSGL